MENHDLKIAQGMGFRRGLRPHDGIFCTLPLATGLIIAVVILITGPVAPVSRAKAAGNGEAAAPPIAGRPPDFTGAIGSHFFVKMRVAPTQVQAEDPLLLTVSVSGTGGLEGLQRPHLRRLPRFADQFHIEDLAERYLRAESVHEFDYRLRPRSAAVKEIPALSFVFFNPKILPPEKGFQRTLAQAIPLTVQPRAEVSPARVEGMAPSLEKPDSIYQIVEGIVVLRHDPFPMFPGPFELGALLIGPPVVGACWYIIWRRRYSDAVSQARKWRSRAAQRAVRALRRLGKLEEAAQAEQAEDTLAGYLRQRLALHSVEPTPAEIARSLDQAGVAPALTQEVARFFTDCDAARFAPGLTVGTDNWPATATRLVLALEESWPLRHS